MEKKVKKLSGIKLNQLRENELEKREMKALKGGSYCCCSCSMPAALDAFDCAFETAQGC